MRGIGRGGHDQDVRRPAALGAQRVALLDAEAVLLVDDDEAEVGELDALLEQRVGADDDAGPALGDLGARLALRRGLERAGEQGDAGAGGVAVELAGAAERAEQLADAAGVLGGEDLGRGEQGRLAAGVDDLGHGPQRDDGLARADLALQQPVHRLVAVELGGQLLPHRPLPLGELERQRGVDGVEQAAGPRAAGRCRARGRRRGGGRRGSAGGSAPRPTSAGAAARSTSSMVVGRWMSSSAAASESRPWRARMSSGSGSSTSSAKPPPAPSSSLTDFWITQLETSLLAG